MGKPESVEWYAEGRLAIRQEVLDSIDNSLPALEQVAREAGAPESLERAINRFQAYLP